MDGDIVQDLWNDHVGWSVTAGNLKSSRVFWRSTALVLTVAGAALQTWAAAAPGREKLIGGVGAVCLAIVPFVTARFLTPERTRKWLRARSISEGIKSEIFSYRARVEPYDGPDAPNQLRQSVREIQSWGTELELDRAAVDPPQTPAPSPLGPEGYLKERVDQQISTYYRPNAKFNARRAEQFRWVETGLSGLAAVAGAYASFSGSQAFGPWVAVLTTSAGAIAAHAAASRYDLQATTFFATARQLEDLKHGWKASTGVVPSKEWSEFVRACEEAISAENRAWMAKLDQNR